MEKEEQFSPFPPQHPLDSSAGMFYNSVDWQNNEFLVQERLYDTVPLVNSTFHTDPLYASILDIEQSSSLTQENNQHGNDINGNGFWNELAALFEPKRQMLLQSNNESDIGEGSKEDERKAKRCREDKCNSNSTAKTLSRKVISQYFYMPITQAAKELNVGLTLLKKRCRELGIRRWPHRKLLSIQTLIKNVQVLQKEEGEGSEMKVREAVEVLERERKMLEEMPDMQLEEKTRRLRQACFKANYKKRKLMMSTMMESSTSGAAGNVASFTSSRAYDVENEVDEDDEEVKSLFSNSFSSTN
ncbi:hypothetical protein PTKIN_Ptkin05aG0171500 [Pterospermum kingtungense]